VRPQPVPAYLWLLLASSLPPCSGRDRSKERGTWWLEVTPVLIGVPILAATYRRFPLTSLVYVLVWIHAIILMVAGITRTRRCRYSTGSGMSSAGQESLRPCGHLAQGFVPAILAREILLRTSPLRPGVGWSSWCVACASPSARCTS